jgi:DNA-binding transcriptional regulator YbjK
LKYGWEQSPRKRGDSMTVASKVKQTLATMKGIEALIKQYSETEQHPEVKEVWKHQIDRTTYIIKKLEERIKQLEYQEPQYKGF